MRILHIGYRLPPDPGGKERYIERLVHEQTLRGHTVTVAHRRGDVPRGAQTLPPIRTGLSRAVSRRSDVVAFGMECARALRRARRFDIVHLHGDHREALGLGAAARRLGIPSVLHVHGALTVRHQRIMPWALRHIDGFVVSGERPRAGLLTAGIPDRLMRIVPSGVAFDHLTRLRERHPVEQGLIVSVGSLVKVKNHALTIHAFHRLRATHPGVRLVIAGDGPERARLERLAGTGSEIEFAGHLSPDDVYSLMGRAQILVHASHRFPTIGEGIPTAPMEALALGTAVIVSSDSSLDPAIADEDAYRVFRTQSAEDLLTQLRTVLDDEMLCLRLMQRGVRAVAEHDWPLVAGHIEKWYETFLADRASLFATGVS
ncbi:glycosyltransferase family 4 protein [Streptosporangium sp. CA-115845]|uniref:glycosyltransferase family 4 protein n=1 Tax=Streptosporangium sp. CA-115845 TaxID=3240071 RepID=UPI003D8FD3A4